MSGAALRKSTRAPRLLVAGAASGCGKTTVACALLQALVDRGLDVRAFKTGPDYIDPMFHSKVIGAESRNLDLFFSTEDEVRALVARGAAPRGGSGDGSGDGDADCARETACPGSSLRRPQVQPVTVIEGAMGYYDGIAVSDEASAWAVARATGTPAVLVVDGRERARSIGAEVLGYVRFREESMVAGVVLNRCAASIYPRLKDVVEEETGVRVFGYLPELADCGLESRHLGLVTADEVEGLRGKLASLAAALEETVDVDALLDLAASAPALEWEDRPVAPLTGVGSTRPRIAVARDAAFCFYYGDSLEALRELGAELVEFSPLRDGALPGGVSGLYLGGGYPELHARALSENQAMREAVARAVRSGVPTIAECGGFMYLHEGIEDPGGRVWPQVGLVPGTCFKTPRLRRFGYVTLEARDDSLLAASGDTLRAHEFHYWDSESCGDAFHAVKPQSSRAWDCVVATPTLYAGFPHLYLRSEPVAARRFVAACASFAAAGSGADVSPAGGA